jgi:hypothetical protein
MAAARSKTKSLLLNVSITSITNKTNIYDIKLKNNDLAKADIFILISISLFLTAPYDI